MRNKIKAVQDRCDLLKIYYLCGSSNSDAWTELPKFTVVICLKFTTFVVAATVAAEGEAPSRSCDLLTIYYLCGSSNSVLQNVSIIRSVVICLKFTTFVVAATVMTLAELANEIVVICLKFTTFVVAATVHWEGNICFC